MYQNNPNTKSINTAKANYSDPWYNTSYSYRKPITIHANQVSHTTEASQSNFPVLISLTDPDLKTTTNSGKVQNDPNGCDIIFSQDGSTQLDHEMEKYDPTTGEIVAWVKIPILSSAADTTLYVYYGNNAINATQEHKTSVWNDGTGDHFKMVQHLGGNIANGVAGHLDSTQYANNGTPNNFDSTATSTTNGMGKIASVDVFDGTNDYVDAGNGASLSPTTAITIDAWVKTPTGQTKTLISKLYSSAYEIQIDSANGFYFGINGTWLTTGGTIPNNAWAHIVTTYDSNGGTNNKRTYINGVLNSQSTQVGAIGTNTGNLNIGKRQGGSVYFTGSMDEVRISDTARSADWIKTEYNNESNPNAFYTLGAEEDTIPPVLAQVTPVPTPTNNATPSYTFSSTKSGTITYGGDCSSSTVSAISGNNTIIFNLLPSGTHSNCTIAIRDGLGNLSNILSVTSFTVNNILTTYIIPAITDNKILPKSSISSLYLGDTISTQVSSGEYKAASFAVNSNVGVSSLQVEATNLTGNGNTVSSAAVDIKTVKCWYQGGSGVDGVVRGRYLTPELLLKDDSLVNVEADNWTQWSVSNPNGKNYLKLADESYEDISSGTPNVNSLDIIPISERSIQDETALQPVNLPANYNKQFWITLHVPDNTPAGNYSGTINLKSGEQTIKSLNLNIRVLPINLPESNIEYSIYYRGKINSNGSISSEDKTVQQYTAEQGDMRLHGITSPTTVLLGTDNGLLQQLSIRQQAGMDNTNLYYTGGISPANIPYYKNLTSPYGVTNIFQYGPDEQSLNDSVHRAQLDSEHNAGGKHFSAQSVSQADNVADILDLAIVSYGLSPTLAAKYHSYGHKIYSYANPQVIPEYPRTFRMNYGLVLWQNDYDGVMDYAYQHSFGDIWNDFDNSTRDHVFAYPTMNGVIGTIQYEGFREGVNDMRYLAALQAEIAAAKSQGENALATEAENYLTSLKNSDLTNQDLDVVRSQIIDYILAFASSSHSLVINRGAGSGFYTQDSKVTVAADIPHGMVFDKWKGDTQYVDNVNASNTTVTMPSHTISLTATFTSPWYDNDYSYRKMITVDYKNVANTDQSNFPILISTIDTSLKGAANGGKIRNANGYDIVFTQPDGILLNYEIESYDNTTGKLVAWVKIPTLSASNDTIIYMYYGNNESISNTQANINGVWENHFKGVWHLGETPTAPIVGDYKDSTQYGNNSTNTTNEPTTTNGQINGAQNFNGTSDYVGLGNSSDFDITDKITISAWVKFNGLDGNGAILEKGGNGSVGYRMYISQSNHRIYFQTKSNDGNTNNIFSLNPITQTDVWHYVVGTVDVNENCTLYVNNEVSSVYHTASSIGTTATPLAISGSAQFINGSIDEVRISDTARSADWIKTEYNNQSSPSTFSTLSPEETILPPTIISLSANLPNGTYGTGTIIPITINFSKDVTSTGNITLTLNTTPERYCSFTITNNNSATCNYTIQGGDSATNLNATISGTIQDQFNNPLTNFTPLSNLSDNTTININTSSSPFIPPTKPNITNIDITVLDNGTMTFNLPSNITQIAISRTPDFANVSWQDFNQDEFSHINETQETLYLKFRTNEGAVSDTIIITPQTSINNTISLIDGDIIQCKSSNDPNAVYIVKKIGTKTYIRHITSIQIFNYYKHLKWENLKQVDSLTPFSLSSWIRVNTGTNGLPKAGDKVYEINGDQTKHWINMTAQQFLSHGGSDEAIYTVNAGELNLYSAGADVVSL